MYTKRTYPFWQMLAWTRYDILKFIIISLIPIILYEVLHWKWLHLPWLPIALVGTALAFIVSFKNNASYDRLWEARKIWGGIVNSSRSFTIMIKDFISNQHTKHPVSEEELTKLKEEFVNRHVAWMAALRHQMRQAKPWETFNSQKANKQYMDRLQIKEWITPLEEELKQHLSEEEVAELMKKGNRASQILGIQSRRLREVKERGLIWEFSYLDLEKMLVEFYTLMGKSERIKNFPYPRQFATLNHLFIWIFIVLLPFGVMNEFDKIGTEMMQMYQDGVIKMDSFGSHWFEHIAGNFVWFTLPFSVMISWIFHSMEKIGSASENPFEGTSNDVPITSISNGIEIDIKQLMDMNNIPEKITPTEGISM